MLDALGRRVGTLHKGSLTPGTHTFVLDAARLAPGAYLVRVVGAASAASRSLTVTR